MKNWNDLIKKPLIIAGPCSAESEQQVLDTARQVSQLDNVRIFRSGIWKPRTRPGSFEGVGDKGLDWLKKVKQETGLLTTTEVARPIHVEKALKAGIDILWIGARTTVNPFLVQELAEAMRGSDVPVMVKNPINPDLQLWLGAIERLQQVGIQHLMAIHRGFSSLSQNKFRNVPNWHLAIEFKSQVPKVPLICDPSHIAGKRDLLAEVSQKAMDLDMDGLMVETHIDPKNARSDAQQQITPAELKSLLDKLVIRHHDITNIEFLTRLEQLRKRIDKIDLDIVDILTARMQVVEEIGLYKKENEVTILQIERWNEILRGVLAQSKSSGVNRDFIKRLYELIHEESIRLQTELMNREVSEKQPEN